MTEKKLSLLQDHCFLCIGSLRILNENKSYSGLLKESIQTIYCYKNTRICADYHVQFKRNYRRRYQDVYDVLQWTRMLIKL